MSGANGEIEIAVTADGVDDAAQELADDGGGGGPPTGGGGGDGGQGDEPMFSAFTKGGIFGGIISSLDSILSVIQPILDIFNAFLAPVAILLLRLLQPFMKGMIMLLPHWMNFMESVLGFVDWWEGIMNGVYDWLFALPGNIWDWLVDGFEWVEQAIYDLPGDIANAIANPEETAEAAADVAASTPTGTVVQAWQDSPFNPIGGGSDLVQGDNSTTESAISGVGDVGVNVEFDSAEWLKFQERDSSVDR